MPYRKFAIAAIVSASFAAGSTPAQASTKCMEDQHCFNWAKMGNHQRGVVTLDGSFKVVGVCGFNRLWSAGVIHYHETMPRLRGDEFARTLTDCPWRIEQKRPYPMHAEGEY